MTPWTDDPKGEQEMSVARYDIYDDVPAQPPCRGKHTQVKQVRVGTSVHLPAGKEETGGEPASTMASP